MSMTSSHWRILALLPLTWVSGAAVNSITSVEALHKDDACSAGSGASCSSELLQVRKTWKGPGKSGYFDETGLWHPTEALVSAVYTYGAPATHQKPFRNMASADGCFAGLRAYTEDMLGSFNEIKQVDAASINNYYPHAWTNTAVLHWGEDSYYIPCVGDQGPTADKKGHPDWPQRGGQVYEEWRLHQENDYADRLNTMTVDGKSFINEEPVKWSRHFVRMAFKAYDTTAEYIKALTELEDDGWKLVGWEVDVNGNDEDPMMLVQDTKSLDCALVFAGTNAGSELSTSTTNYGTGFCGFEGVHVGYRNELWTLGKNMIQPLLRPKLEKCNNVIAVGHSLGGALAELFGACANSERLDDPDFQLISWKKASKPELMDEVAAK